MARNFYMLVVRVEQLKKKVFTVGGVYLLCKECLRLEFALENASGRQFFFHSTKPLCLFGDKFL